MIRRAVAADAAELAQLGERTFREQFAADNTPEDLELYISRTYGETHQRRELERGDHVALVVEVDGVLVAFAQLIVLNPDRIEIARFYVDRPHQGRGLAQELMQHVIATARELGMREVFLGVWERNPRAIRFYEKCGFVDVGSHPFLLGNDLQTDREMLLRLGS